MDRFDDHLGVKLKEGSVVAHLSSLLPIQKNLPKSNRVLVDLLQILEIFSARELVLGHLLLGILVIILIEELQKLSVENDLRSDFVDGLGSLEELLQGVTTVLKPLLVLQVSSHILLFKRLDLPGEHI